MALGEFRGDEALAGALTKLARPGRSYFVEAAANQSIGKLRLPASFDVLASNIERGSYREVVRGGCIEGLVQLRDERGLDLIRASSKYGAPQATRAAAVGTLAALATSLEPSPVGIDEEIAEFMDDPDFRVRMAAMRALRTLKDPSWANRIEAQIDREGDGRAVRTARSIASELRSGASQTEEVKKLRQRLEELRRDQTKLVLRLESFEAKSGS